MMNHWTAKLCGWQQSDWDAFMAQVGPESAGAHPGPVCYRKGGHAAITDANLVLGRILPQFFPNIFGPNGDSLSLPCTPQMLQSNCSHVKVALNAVLQCARAP